MRDRASNTPTGPSTLTITILPVVAAVRSVPVGKARRTAAMEGVVVVAPLWPVPAGAGAALGDGESGDGVTEGVGVGAEGEGVGVGATQPASRGVAGKLPIE